MKNLDKNKIIKTKQQSFTEIVKNIIRNKKKVFILQETAKSIYNLATKI